MSDQIQPHSEIVAAEKQAELEVTQLLQGKGKGEILALASGFTKDYGKILDVRFKADQFSVQHVAELLYQAYPDPATNEKKWELANKVSDLVRQEMGKIEDVPQSELIAASKRRDLTVQELAKQFTPDEIAELDRQAQERVKELPENYTDFKAQWLAEWVAKGLLDYKN